MSYGKVTVNRSMVRDNRTVFDFVFPTTCGGGGIWSRGPITLEGTQVVSNTSQNYGGGLLLWKGTLAATNTIIADNRVIVDDSAPKVGSGLYLTRATASLLHTTLARNTGGDGSGLYLTGTSSTAALTNTILVSHTVGITVGAGSTATLDATLWGDGAWANGTDWGGDGSIISVNGTPGDPAFLDPDAGDYHIGIDSAAVDAGVDTAVEDDLDGDPRPQHGRNDLGADETGLAVIKSAGRDPVPTGGLVTYAIVVTNISDLDLETTVTDVLPLQVHTTEPTVWSPPLLSPGEAWSVELPVRVDVDYVGPLTNVVRVTSDRGPTGVYTLTSNARRIRFIPIVLRDFEP
jgi:uncharacterized repeat protein (TIGR01451 family)